MVRTGVSRCTCLAEYRIHDALGVIALESESGYYKAPLGMPWLSLHLQVLAA